MKPSLTVAPHFHLAGEWVARLLVSDGESWRAPDEAEIASLVSAPQTRDELAACVCLFALPGHLRSAFWSMLARQASGGDGDFVAFAAEAAGFLQFKQLPPPEGSAFELILRPAGAAFQAAGLWAVINLGEEQAVVAWPALRLRLGPGEGCRLPDGAAPEVLPPADDEADVLLVVRAGG
jgi:hypothetical protein